MEESKTTIYHYIQWAAAMLIVAIAAAMFVFSPQLLVVSFAVAIALATFYEISEYRFATAAAGFVVATIVGVIAYVTPAGVLG